MVGEGSSDLGRVIKARRQKLGLSIEAAARAAEISAESWRRYEGGSGIRRDKASGVAKALKLCNIDDLINPAPSGEEPLQNFEVSVMENWKCGVLTPPQALVLAKTLSEWGDTSILEWLNDAEHGPLHSVAPFCYLDLRVMMMVGDNRAWAEAVRERCIAVSREIINDGVVPCMRPGCYMDEVLIAAALTQAPGELRDSWEIYERVALDGDSREEDGEDAKPDPDELAFDEFSEWFDDQSQWGDWEVPVRSRHLLRHILNTRHPFTWFDGPGDLPTLEEPEVTQGRNGWASQV